MPILLLKYCAIARCFSQVGCHHVLKKLEWYERNGRRCSVLRQPHKRWAWSGQVSRVSQVTSRWPLVVKATDYLKRKFGLNFFWGAHKSVESRLLILAWLIKWSLFVTEYWNHDRSFLGVTLLSSVFSVTEFEKRIGAATLNWILFYFLPPCCLALLVVDCVSLDELLASFMSSLSWLYKKVWCFWFRSPVIAALPLSPGLNI